LRVKGKKEGGMKWNGLSGSVCVFVGMNYIRAGNDGSVRLRMKIERTERKLSVLYGI
jgi:hypothetical protein